MSFVITDDFPAVKTENIFWQFSSLGTQNTMTIQSNSKISFSEDRLSLIFNNIELSERGNYTLTATNEAGTTNATITMDVHGNHYNLLSINYYNYSLILVATV